MAKLFDAHPHTEAAHGDGGNPLGVPSVVLSLVLVAALAHPSPLLLPLLSALFVSVGFGSALVQWIRYRSKPDRMVAKMSLAGLLVFFGFAAAILSDPDAASQSLSHLR